ncbi:thymidylate kinase [Candidatus Pacearchaeota archaeon]|nr:thymidylate kinase [Candidatus Pacearchaeota archaeon]
MSKGKLIAIGGTDASGKETQTKLLVHKLNLANIPCKYISFPMYGTPTGKIVGGALLGKQSISKSYFENPAEVDSKTASLYYAADRHYNKKIMEDTLNSGTHLISDRYVESNMGHQGGKIKNPEERLKFFKWLEDLEYGLLQLPKPDLTILLYMPYKVGMELKSKMGVEKDEVEKNIDYLKNSEESYLQLAKLYNWKKVDCIKNGELRTKEDISDEVYNIVRKII